MGKSLGEIDNLPASEFYQWMQYHSLFPFGESRDDWRMGMIASTIANVNRGKNTPAFKADDFVLKPPKTQRQKDADLRAALKRK